MIYKGGDVARKRITIYDPATGQPVAPDSIPTASLRVGGSSGTATVTPVAENPARFDVEAIVPAGATTETLEFDLKVTIGGIVYPDALSIGVRVGYDLSDIHAKTAAIPAFPANFSTLAIDGSGRVTAGTVSDKAGYSLAQSFPANFAALAIDADGRVTAGAVTDKNGYALAGDGLDAITVEPGVNARQALSPILAAAAGTLDGAGTGTITIQGGNGSTTRIKATTDAAGNRTSVILTLPT